MAHFTINPGRRRIESDYSSPSYPMRGRAEMFLMHQLGTKDYDELGHVAFKFAGADASADEILDTAELILQLWFHKVTPTKQMLAKMKAENDRLLQKDLYDPQMDQDEGDAIEAVWEFQRAVKERKQEILHHWVMNRRRGTKAVETGKAPSAARQQLLARIRAVRANPLLTWYSPDWIFNLDTWGPDPQQWGAFINEPVFQHFLHGHGINQSDVNRYEALLEEAKKSGGGFFGFGGSKEPLHKRYKKLVQAAGLPQFSASGLMTAIPAIRAQGADWKAAHSDQVKRNNPATFRRNPTASEPEGAKEFAETLSAKKFIEDLSPGDITEATLVALHTAPPNTDAYSLLFWVVAALRVMFSGVSFNALEEDLKDGEESPVQALVENQVAQDKTLMSKDPQDPKYTDAIESYLMFERAVTGTFRPQIEDILWRFSHRRRNNPATSSKRNLTQSFGADMARKRKARANPQVSPILSARGYNAQVLWPRYTPGGGTNSGSEVPFPPSGTLQNNLSNLIDDTYGSYNFYRNPDDAAAKPRMSLEEMLQLKEQILGRLKARYGNKPIPKEAWKAEREAVGLSFPAFRAVLRACRPR